MGKSSPRFILIIGLPNHDSEIYSYVENPYSLPIKAQTMLYPRRLKSNLDDYKDA